MKPSLSMDLPNHKDQKHEAKIDVESKEVPEEIRQSETLIESMDEVKLQSYVATNLRNIISPVQVPLSQTDLQKSYETLVGSEKIGGMRLPTLKMFAHSIGIDEDLSESMFHHMDGDKNGYLDFDEFTDLIRFLTLKKLKDSDKIYFDTLFKMIDVDGDETINPRELRQFINHMHEMAELEEKSKGIAVEGEASRISIIENGFSTMLEKDVMTYNDWMLNIFELDALSSLGLNPNKVQIKRTDFQIFLEAKGFAKYFANEIFSHIDTDNSGSLDTEEIEDYLEYLKSQDTFSNRKMEFAIFAMQICFIGCLIWKLKYVDDWNDPEMWVTFVEVFTACGGIYLFAQLVFQKHFENVEVENILQGIVDFMRAKKIRS